ncbi:hypothetical protein SVAN01_03621 [Stagonosporopsis vannaccii]|nr:hypothetical protein SVAN01_03621 [Stagonosporopsis vannaccii]
MSESHGRLSTASSEKTIGEQITGIGAWAQKAQKQPEKSAEAVPVNEVPIVTAVGDDEPSIAVVVASDRSEPWSEWSVAIPMQSLDAARVTATTAAVRDEAAVWVSPDAGSQATITLDGTRTEWNSTATAAEIRNR